MLLVVVVLVVVSSFLGRGELVEVGKLFVQMWY